MPSPLFEPGSFPAEHGVLTTLFRRASTQNALAELNEALCQAESLRALPVDLLDHVRAHHGIDLRTRCAPELHRLYRIAANFYLHQPTLSEDDRGGLTHLQLVLNIGATDAAPIHRSIGLAVLREAVRGVFANAQGSPSERSLIPALINKRGLSTSDVREILVSEGGEAIRRMANRAIQNKGIDPQQEHSIKALAASLNIPLDGTTDLPALLEKGRRLWQLREGPMPVVPGPMNLQPKESFVARVECSLNEMRQVTVNRRLALKNEPPRVSRSARYVSTARPAGAV
jgi:hypothetical protein